MNKILERQKASRINDGEERMSIQGEQTVLKDNSSEVTIRRCLAPAPKIRSQAKIGNVMVADRNVVAAQLE